MSRAKVILLIFEFVKKKVMENLLSDDFDVKAKHSSEEALQKWRKVCGVVKNPKRRFRFTANFSKRDEAKEMRRTNQVPLLVPNSSRCFFFKKNFLGILFILSRLEKYCHEIQKCYHMTFHNTLLILKPQVWNLCLLETIKIQINLKIVITSSSGML